MDKLVNSVVFLGYSIFSFHIQLIPVPLSVICMILDNSLAKMN